jgi:hypothetical protein
VATVEQSEVGVPSGVRLVSILVAIDGLITLIDGALGINLGLSGASTSAGAPSGTPLVVGGLVQIVIAVVAFALAYMLTHRSNVARWIVIVLGLVLLGARIAALVALPDHRISLLVRALILALVVVLLLTPKARDFYRSGSTISE